MQDRMELNKLLKKKTKAQQEGNKLAVAEVAKQLGSYYMQAESQEYEKAVGEFREAAEIFRQTEKKMDEARTHRFWGEALLLLRQYKEALKHENIYLKMAKEEKELVEVQRAYASLGRAYLLKAEAENDNNNGNISNNEDFKAAERAFLKGLLICKDLGKLVSKHELADMQARILLNLGMMNEHKYSTCSSDDEAIKNYEKAIKLCRSNDLYELHHSSLMALGYYFDNKLHDSVSALKHYNNAYEVAKRVESKNEKMCETLLAKGLLLIKNGDFQSGRLSLKKAYRIRTTVESDMEAIQKKFRVVNALCKSEDELITTDTFDYVKRRELFEKLGDAACKLKNYTKGIDFYRKMLEAAELNGETGKQLIPIYVSLYQTFIDMKDYENALEFLHKEYELIKDIPKEACATLLSIANLLHSAKRDFWEIDSAFRKALTEARSIPDDNFVTERIVLKKLISVCKEFHMTTMAEILSQEATERQIDLGESNDEEESEEVDFSEDILNDIIAVEDSELSTDAESSDDNSAIPKLNTTATKKSSAATANSVGPLGRRKRSMAVKKNAKGETRLHEACINGNYQLAKMLIEQGHAINVRDNAGWMPLHEAANHGHRDIVELLLDNGAQSAINDKGGANCDGISPLFDAAANGHLSVVQLLLDRGAKATIKTDANETPLDALVRYYDDNVSSLNTSEREFYENLKARLTEQCEKVGIDISSSSKNNVPSSFASSGYGSIKAKSLSQRQQQQHQQQQNSRRFNTNFSDESDSGGGDGDCDDNSVSNKRDSKKSNAVAAEYKNVIERLRNPHRNRKHEQLDGPNETKKRSAYLNTREIDPDDWLENDIEPTRKKQRFYNEISFQTARDDADDNNDNDNIVYADINDSSVSKSNLFAAETSSRNILIESDDDEEKENGKETTPNEFDYDEINAVDAFDLMMANAEGNGSTVASRAGKGRRNSQSKSKNQSSLFDAGFSRFFQPAADDTKATKKSISSPIKSHNSSFNESQSRNSFGAAAPPPEKQTTIIKVQIDNEKIIVPIDRTISNERKISWLIEESARRYYCLKGIRPELKLKTADGATLLESDALDIVLCLKDDDLIYSEILDWKLPSLSNRYLEACSELKCGVDREMSEFLDLNRTAINLDLSNQNLRTSCCRPILKALHHQSCLIHLDLSSNFIQDEGIKYLSQTLITLRHLTTIDVSGNGLTESGVEHLSNILRKNSFPVEIKCLKLSFNPIRSVSLNHISELCRSKSIASLSVTSCELEDAGAMEKLYTVKDLEIGYNHLSLKGFKDILRKLNPTIVERINLERCTNVALAGESIVEFITSGCYASLRELNLSGLKLNEIEILNILRCLERCENLRYLDLSYQKELTFLSLKYLLFNMNNRNLNINLMGCQSLHTASDVFNICRSHDDLSCHPCQLQLSLPHRNAEIQRNEFIEKIRDIWDNVTHSRGMVEVGNKSLRLFCE